MTARRKIIFYLLGIAVTLLVIFSVGELIARMDYARHPDPPPPVPNPPYDYRQLDETLGWFTKPNYSYQGSMPDLSGKEYAINITTDENGFRSFGNPKTTGKTKVFFLGDSYTHAVEVTNSKTFYSLLQDSLPIEVFAYGAAGYGNLQEFLILDKYFDEIKPDIVVLQLCSNDFIDNYDQLELISNYKVGKPRPYLTEKDKIVYLNPIPTIDKIKEHSKFLYFLASRIKKIKDEHLDAPREPGEKLIAELGTDYTLFEHSIKITELILKRFKKRIPENVEFFVFVSDHYQPQLGQFKNICLKNNIRFIEGVPEEVLRRENNGEVVRSNDGYHWNETGHRIVADEIFKELQPIVSNR